MKQTDNQKFERTYDVTFVGDHYRLTTTVRVYVTTEDGVGDYTAYEEARAILTEQVGFDPAAYAHDLIIEAAY